MPTTLGTVRPVGIHDRILLALVAANLLLRVVGGVAVDDLSDERVAHDILTRETREVDVFHVAEDLADQLQTRRTGGQVDLGHVARDDHAGTETESGEEHLHLLGRRVLRLVEHDERVVQGATAHVGERRDLDRAGGEQLGNQLGIHHLVERVVQRPQVRVDLVVQRAGQEAEPLPRFDRRSTQDDALDLFTLQRLHGLRHREVRLAGTGRPDAEDDRVVVDRVDVGLLTQSLGPDALAAARENRLREHVSWAALAAFQDARARRHIGRPEVDTVLDHRHQFLHEPLGGAHLVVGTLEGHVIAAHQHGDGGVSGFDRVQQAVLGAEQPHHGDAVDLEFRASGTARLAGVGFGHRDASVRPPAKT